MIAFFSFPLFFFIRLVDFDAGSINNNDKFIFIFLSLNSRILLVDVASARLDVKSILLLSFLFLNLLSRLIDVVTDCFHVVKVGLMLNSLYIFLLAQHMLYPSSAHDRLQAHFIKTLFTAVGNKLKPIQNATLFRRYQLERTIKVSMLLQICIIKMVS